MSNIFQKFDSQTLILMSEEALAEVTATFLIKAFSNILRKQATLTFIPSSGRTPVKTYQHLTQNYRHAIDWSRVTIVQMDEYYADNLDPKLYFHNFLRTHLVAPLNIENFISMHDEKTASLYAPNAYRHKLNALGSIDFALHGIGRNGHIGFNEPYDDKHSETRIVELCSETQDDNFPNMKNENRPKQGMTLGLKDLARVKHSLLIASGEHKAKAIKELMNRAPISKTPACALWNSPDFGIILDRQAAKDVV